MALIMFHLLSHYYRKYIYFAIYIFSLVFFPSFFVQDLKIFRGFITFYNERAEKEIECFLYNNNQPTKYEENSCATCENNNWHC